MEWSCPLAGLPVVGGRHQVPTAQRRAAGPTRQRRPAPRRRDARREVAVGHRRRAARAALGGGEPARPAGGTYAFPQGERRFVAPVRVLRVAARPGCRRGRWRGTRAADAGGNCRPGVPQCPHTTEHRLVKK